MTLAEARDKAADARKQLRDGTDPLAAKATAKAEAAIATATFEQAALMLLKHLIQQRADTKFPGRTASRWQKGFANHVFPKIGKLDVRDLRHAHIAGVLAPSPTAGARPSGQQRAVPRSRRCCARGLSA